MKVTINVEFAIGDFVRIKFPDSDKCYQEGIVIGYIIPLGEVVQYQLQHCDGTTGKYWGITLEKVEPESIGE